MTFESRMDIWLRFDKYTPYYYRKFLERLHSQNKYSSLVSRYAEKKDTDPPRPLSKKYLAKNRIWLSRQNVRFIENARETYEAGLRASSHIKPILYHYSWHSFLAFLMYTFMRFDGRARGHGITVTKMERNEINLDFHPFRKKGFFQRVLDTLTILGYPLAFARWIPILKEKDTLVFMENTISPFADIKRINLKDILTFNQHDYIREFMAKFESKHPRTHELANMNECVRSFITLFTASTITRYKPQVWSEILEGEREYESMSLTQVRDSYENYVYFVTQMHEVLKKSI